MFGSFLDTIGEGEMVTTRSANRRPPRKVEKRWRTTTDPLSLYAYTRDSVPFEVENIEFSKFWIIFKLYNHDDVILR